MTTPQLGFDDLEKRVKNGSATNSLFFAARNGAIANLCLSLQNYFQDNGFSVRVDWEESSIYEPIIKLKITLGKGKFDLRNIYLNRTSQGIPSEKYSNCLYTLKNIDAGAYYRGLKPAKAVAFDELLEKVETHKLVEELVLGTNFPFKYKRYSSF